MGDAPAFSVLMSAYNAADYIEAAVRSVLDQRFGDFELLIMDDGSTDASPAVLDRFDDARIRRWRRPNGGRPSALNALLDQARGRWMIIQDADDVSPPDRFGKIAARLEAEPALDAVMTGHSLLIGDRALAPRGADKTPEECARDVAAYRMPAHDPTMACRMAVARTLRFDEALAVGEGVDFTLRVGERYRVAVIGESLYWYRVNETSVTRTKLSRRVAVARRTLDAARARRGVAAFTDAEFAAFYGPTATDPTNNLIGHFIDSAYQQVMAGRRAGALGAAWDALRLAPLGPRSVKPLIYALSPRPLARRLRRA